MRSIVRADESYDESRDGWVILGGGDTDGSAYWQPKVTIEAVSRSDADEIEVSLWRRHPLFRWKRTEKIAGGKPRWSGGSASWTGGDAVRTGRWRNTILEIEVHWAEKKRRQRHVVDLVTRGYQFAVYALFALVLGIGWLVRPAFFEAAIPMLEKPLESWLALGGLVTGWGGLELMGGFLLEKVLKREPAPLSLPLRQLLLFPIGGLAAAAALILLTPVAVACNTTGAQPELAVVGKLAPAGSDGACRALLGSEIELRSGPDAPRVHSAPASCDESWAKSRPSASCFKLGCESRSWGPFPLNATTDCKVDGLAGAPAPEVATLDGKPFEAPAQWTAKDGFKASSTCMVAKGTPVKLLDAKAAGVRRAVVRGQRDGKLVELSTFDSEAGSSEAWLCTPPVFDEVALAGDAIEWQVPAAWIAGPRLSIAESTPATCQKGLADEELLAVRLLGVQSVGAGAWLRSLETSDARARCKTTVGSAAAPRAVTVAALKGPLEISVDRPERGAGLELSAGYAFSEVKVGGRVVACPEASEPRVLKLYEVARDAGPATTLEWGSLRFDVQPDRHVWTCTTAAAGDTGRLLDGRAAADVLIGSDGWIRKPRSRVCCGQCPGVATKIRRGIPCRPGRASSVTVAGCAEVYSDPEACRLP